MVGEIGMVSGHIESARSGTLGHSGQIAEKVGHGEQVGLGASKKLHGEHSMSGQLVGVGTCDWLAGHIMSVKEEQMFAACKYLHNVEHEVPSWQADKRKL